MPSVFTYRDEESDSAARTRMGRRIAARKERVRKGRDRRRSLSAMIMLVLVFAALALGAWWGFDKIRDFFVPPDYRGAGTGEVLIRIDKGDSASDIGNELTRKGVVKSARAFVNVAEADERGRSLQPGTYQLRKRMSAASALQLLLDPASKVSRKFTIGEGRSVNQTLAKISQDTGIPLAELTAAASKPAELGIPSWGRGKLEGFLFPDTYELAPNDSATDALRAMVQRGHEVRASIDFDAAAARLARDPYEVLAIGSLIEGEGIPADFGKISRVVYNRLGQDMLLQFDSTTQYWLEQTGKGRKKNLTNDELRNPDNSYSTTVHKGLPPTAIANPGKAALLAALNPEAGPWLFFVRIDEAGNSAFTDDVNVHDQNVEICRQKDLGC